MISLYQEFEFLISRNRILDIKIAYLHIKNSIYEYQEIIHISWYQKIEFLISRNRFFISSNRILDIKKCILRRRYTFYQVFLDIKNLISWYQELISKYNSWYQEMIFISWYKEMELLISRYGIIDIKKSISLYQEFDFLIVNISWYQEIVNISWYQEIKFLISRNPFLDIKRKRKRSDSDLWQTPLHQQKFQKGKVTTQTTPQKSSIIQRLWTELGRSVGVTTATKLVWLTWFTDQTFPLPATAV